MASPNPRGLTRGHIWRRLGGKRRKEWRDAYRRLAHGRGGEVKLGKRPEPDWRTDAERSER